MLGWVIGEDIVLKLELAREVHLINIDQGMF